MKMFKLLEHEIDELKAALKDIENKTTNYYKSMGDVEILNRYAKLTGVLKETEHLYLTLKARYNDIKSEEE